MTPFKSRLFVSTAALLCIFTVGCNDEDENRQETFQQNQVEAGTYAADRCFKNKIATAAAAADRFSLAELTINPDTTGSIHYRNFSDATCVTLVADETVTFGKISPITIGTALVLKLEQNGNVLDPNWYVPTALADGGYFFEVDFADGDSGPYIVEPSAAEIDDFVVNPAAQGVRFVKQ